jgi:hypothetical protein
VAVVLGRVGLIVVAVGAVSVGHAVPDVVGAVFGGDAVVPVAVCADDGRGPCPFDVVVASAFFSAAAANVALAGVTGTACRLSKLELDPVAERLAELGAGVCNVFPLLGGMTCTTR